MSPDVRDKIYEDLKHLKLIKKPKQKQTKTAGYNYNELLLQKTSYFEFSIYLFWCNNMLVDAFENIHSCI